MEKKVSLIRYLFPIDWEDKEILNINSFSPKSGCNHGLDYIVIVQRSPSTGRYRKTRINISE